MYIYMCMGIEFLRNLRTRIHRSSEQALSAALRYAECSTATSDALQMPAEGREWARKIDLAAQVNLS